MKGEVLGTMGRAVCLAAAVFGLAALLLPIWLPSPAVEPEPAVQMQTQPTRIVIETQPEPPAQTAAPVSVPVKAPEREAEPVPEVHTLTLMALGDDLIHNTLITSAKQPDGTLDFSEMYEPIAAVTEQYDLACINQETILVSDPRRYAGYPSFGSPFMLGDALAEAGFDIVTHATNHAWDNGETGLLDTIGFWRDNHPEITVLGVHDTQEDAETIRIVEKNGIRLALLNYTYDLNGYRARERWQVDLLDDPERVCAQVAQAREEADFVVVFAHWGEEYFYEPRQSQRQWGQRMADAGADLIIGAHPHVLEPLETLTAADGRQVPVFWSLGNFVSHQLQPDNMLGGMASVTITKDGSGAYLSACELIPTVNVILYDQINGWYDYRPMLLADYNDDLASRHVLNGMGVEKIWALFEQITGIPRPAEP